MARAMISEYGLPYYLWAEAVNTSCYISNRVFLCKNTSKTSFEIYFSRKPNVSYFKVFSCKCFILNTKDNLGKFNAKSYEAIFIGYSNTSKAYRVFNKSSLIIEESIHVKFEESNMFVENVVEIDSLNEDMEKISLKDSLLLKTCLRVMKILKFKKLKWRQLNHFQKIGDSIHTIPRILSWVKYQKG